MRTHADKAENLPHSDVVAINATEKKQK